MVSRVLLTAFAMMWMLDGTKPCMGTRNKMEKEESAIAKRVNKNLVLM